MSAANDDVKIMTVASCSNVREEHRSHVVVSGSYGGRYNAYNAAKWGVRGVIMNDAGIGKDNAGIRGLDFLDQINLAAAAADATRTPRSVKVGERRRTRSMVSTRTRAAVKKNEGQSIRPPPTIPDESHNNPRRRPVRLNCT